MAHAKTPLRPGMTAIAAVLALSSTPLFAQSAEPAAIEAAPPPLITPPPVVAPASVISTTPAPAIVAPAPIARTAAAPAPAAEPIVQSARPAARVAAPTPRAAPTAAPRTVTAAPRTVSAAPAATPVVAATPAPVAPPPAPIIDEPVATPAPTPAAKTVDATDDMLPVAGAAGAAILLLGGGAYALSRRRRREDEEVVYAADEVTVPVAAARVTPDIYAQPVGYVEPRFTPAAARTPEGSSDAPVTTLPSGFDISRFGRHTQAAYRGPTPGNPSHSLRNRLKRASFFDQRERMAAEGTLPPQASATPAPTAQPAMAPRQTDHVTTRINPAPRPGFRPAYSS